MHPILQKGSVVVVSLSDLLLVFCGSTSLGRCSLTLQAKSHVQCTKHHVAPRFSLALAFYMHTEVCCSTSCSLARARPRSLVLPRSLAPSLAPSLASPRSLAPSFVRSLAPSLARPLACSPTLSLARSSLAPRSLAARQVGEGDRRPVAVQPRRCRGVWGTARSPSAVGVQGAAPLR